MSLPSHRSTEPDTKEPSRVVPTGPLLFLKEVAKYFMDFLETDFHKRRTPKRAIRFRNADNLLTGLQLTKYPTFNAALWRSIRSAFSNGLNHVGKGEYRTSIPKSLLELVHLQVVKIPPEKISGVIAEISDELGKIAILYAEEYDQALSSAIESTANHLRAEIVRPLLETIEKPIQNLDLGDENNLYIIEEELVEVLVQLLTAGGLLCASTLAPMRVVLCLNFCLRFVPVEKLRFKLRIATFADCERTAAALRYDPQCALCHAKPSFMREIVLLRMQCLRPHTVRLMSSRCRYEIFTGGVQGGGVSSYFFAASFTSLQSWSLKSRVSRCIGSSPGSCRALKRLLHAVQTPVNGASGPLLMT
jgi:hypothetical protein